MKIKIIILSIFNLNIFFKEIKVNKKVALIIDVEKLAQRISNETNFSGRSIVLGHIQRGGTPVPEDRILASQMGQFAVELLLDNKSGYCVCKKDNKIIARKIDEALQDINETQLKMYQLFEDLV